MRSANIRYLPQIDHLRALAAVWIVLYHGVFTIGPSFQSAPPEEAVRSAVTYNPLYALLVDGHTAVALFMVLSGFIFTVGSFGKAISYKDFIINRVLRIYPLYIAVILLYLCNNHNDRYFTDLVTTVLPLADFKLDGHWPDVAMAWA